MLNSINL